MTPLAADATTAPAPGATTFDALLTEHRTARAWAPTPVPDDLLTQVYDVLRWGPSAMNSTPLRLLEIRSADARERLARHMSGGNAEVVRSAPLPVVVAADPRWHDDLDTLAPHLVGMRDGFEADEAGRTETARANAWLQAGYLVLALRARGLAVGTMNGMDTAAIDTDLLAGTGWHSLMVVNVGYPAQQDDAYPRAARLTAALAVRVL